jgi:hypothetical protein
VLALSPALISCRIDQKATSGAENQHVLIESLGGQGKLKLEFRSEVGGLTYGVRILNSCSPHEGKLLFQNFTSPQKSLLRVDFFQMQRREKGGNWMAFGPVYKVPDLREVAVVDDRKGLPIVTSFLSDDFCVADTWCRDCSK